MNVPIKGQKHDTLHLIDEDLAMQFLRAKDILRFRLALATKPDDVFFLCQVPTRNIDNSWNETNLEGCEQAKTLWTKVDQPQRGRRRRLQDRFLPATPTPSPSRSGRRNRSAS